MRIFPAILIFVLGIVNIISVLTPALPERMRLLKDYLLVGFVSFSNSFVFIAGLFLLVTAAFMLRGLRTAWWFAIGFSIISVFGHITKGIDYEEATIALADFRLTYCNQKRVSCKNESKTRNSWNSNCNVKYGSCIAVWGCGILLSR